MSTSLPKLGPIEARVFTAWKDTDPDWAYPFRSIAKHSGVERHHIRRAVRSLARKGLVVFRKGLFTEDGEVAGSGYALTHTGYLAICAICYPEPQP